MERAMWPDLATVEALYNQNRFLDAWRLTAPLWERAEIAAELTIDEILMASRLAHRLGGGKVGRALARLAIKRDPGNPKVRYFASARHNRESTMLDILLEYELQSELATDDAELQASWLASQALYWAMIRDFDRAFALLARADALNCDRPWVEACRGHVLLAADRWEEALVCAETALAGSPGMPACVGVLASALGRNGRVEEAAERLLEIAANGQSIENAQIAVWYACAAAEHSWPDRSESWLTRADALAETLHELAPLADRDTRISIAQHRLDVALTANRPEAVLARAEQMPWPFATAMAKSIRERPPGELLILPFKPVYQKHDTCMPASMVSILAGMGRETDEDALAAAITYGGTPSWKAAEWLAEQGLHVRQCLLTPELARRLLTGRFPFLFLLEWDDGAHATAAIGIDTAADLMLVHDPSRTRHSRYLLEHIGDTELPIGPEAMIFCEMERAAVLDAIVPVDPVAVARRQFFRTLDRSGARVALAELRELAVTHQDHPVTRYLRAVGDSMVGDTRQAIDALLILFREYPSCTAIRRSIVAALYQTGSTGYLRETLRDIAVSGRVAGMEGGDTWRYPPGRYICQYADILGLSAEHVDEAERLVLQVLKRESHNALAWHVLADLRYRARRLDDCDLPYRVASCLQTENAHYARALADLRRRVGREADGIAYLERRARQKGGHPAGAEAWTTLIDALEDFGYPEAADRQLQAAFEHHPDTPEMAHYGMHFHIRMGRWSQAEQFLRLLQESDQELLAMAAATAFYEQGGDWQRALSFCQQWLEASPEDMTARRALARLIAHRDGNQAAVDLVESWSQAHPDDETYEELLFEKLPMVGRDREIVPLIEARLARNPDDAWAWRELSVRLLEELEHLPPEARGPLRLRLDETMAGCRRTGPDNEVTKLLESSLARLTGDFEAAAAAALAALRQEPAMAAGYRRVWAVLNRLSESRQQELRDELEILLLQVVGRLYPARDLAFLIVSTLGLDEALAAIGRWQAVRPQDPVLAEAAADLLLEYGQGRTDAEKAKNILVTAIEQFPAFSGLKQSLARACNILLDVDGEVAICEQFLQQVPTDIGIRLQLAELHRRCNRPDQARALLEQGIAISPRHSGPRNALARFFWMQGDHAGSLETLRSAVRQIPDSVSLLEALIDCYFDLGDEAAALAAARDAASRRPDQAGFWLNLARTLHRTRLDSDFGELENAYRTVLRLEADQFEAADELAVHFVHRRDFAAARGLIEPRLAEMADPTAARGRLAWILRQEGDGPGARDTMVKLLCESPWYAWGWGELMDWLEEDEDPQAVKSILALWPAALADDVTLRSRRLLMLENAEFDDVAIEQEWLQLVADFPRATAVTMRRFDRLWGAGRFDEARGILSQTVEFHPEHAAVLARQTAMLLHDGSIAEAYAAAEKVWFMADADNGNAEYRAWEAFVEADLAAGAADRLEHHLAQGRPAGLFVTHHVLQLFVREKGGQKRIMHWLTLIDAIHDRDMGGHRARAMSALSDLKKHDAVVKYWKKLPEAQRDDTIVWQQAAHSLLEMDSIDARGVLSRWPEHPGVEMFIACNHVIACQKYPILPEEIRTSALTALASLPHDWTARFLACAAAEASLREARPDLFLEVWQQWGTYIEMEPPEGRFYENDWLRECLPFIGLCHELLTAAAPLAELPRLQAAARPLLIGTRSLGWAVPIWFRLVRQRTPETGFSWWPQISWRLVRFFKLMR